MENRIKFVYIILIFLSIFAYILGHFEIRNYAFVAIVLFSTFIKGKLIIDYFMELKKCSKTYVLIPTLWLFLVLVLIGYTYISPHI